MQEQGLKYIKLFEETLARGQVFGLWVGADITDRGYTGLYFTFIDRSNIARGVRCKYRGTRYDEVEYLSRLSGEISDAFFRYVKSVTVGVREMHDFTVEGVPYEFELGLHGHSIEAPNAQNESFSLITVSSKDHPGTGAWFLGNKNTVRCLKSTFKDDLTWRMERELMKDRDLF